MRRENDTKSLERRRCLRNMRGDGYVITPETDGDEKNGKVY